jgi:hypothetical protein
MDVPRSAQGFSLCLAVADDGQQDLPDWPVVEEALF